MATTTSADGALTKWTTADAIEIYIYLSDHPFLFDAMSVGESSAMGAKGGSHANAAELVSPRNYEVESTSVQLTPVRGNEQAADDTPVKSEEGNDEKGKN